MSVKASAVTYTEHGKDFQNVLQLTEFTVDPSQLKPNQILLKTLATPINPADLGQIVGGYNDPKPHYLDGKPVHIGGNEGLYKVIHLGSDVKNYNVGDWVIPKLPSFGTWRNYALVTVEENDTTPLIVVSNDDDALTLEQAATISINPSTAYQILNQFIKDWSEDGNDWVIQNSGNSQVSKYVSQFAKLKNVKTISVIRDGKSDEVIKELYDLGATKVIFESQLTADDFSSKVLPDIIGEKGRVRLALNGVSGPTVPHLFKSLSENGILVTYGIISGSTITYDARLQFSKNLTTAGFWLTKNTLRSPQFKVDTIHELLKLYKEGKVIDPSFTKVPFKEGDNLLRTFLESIGASSKGKQVIVYE
ncbi:mitochondrial 2-enoyl thioester reductase [Scheffersomyces xylosifermentans]|uniref:mitochondrial 2-enoyl thioester reductase n=1 Tax=Scheffersomyces xylosifermentans TaxID=1304137 RepID=UPI00315D8953